MSIRYMIVDDTVFVRELVKAVMKSAGHVCVAEAADGVEALALTSQTLPDLILMDLVMPRMNGVNSAKAIRDVWPEARIVAFTTMNREDLSGDGSRVFDGWLSKPFDKEQILETVRSLFPNEGKTEVRND